MQTLDLTTATTTFLDALLSSASVETIGVPNWWDRARSALETAAAGADSYQHAVAIACRKLQIETLSESSARTLAELESIITPRFDEWRQIAERDAVYLVALTRIARTNRKEQQ